jgi:hypothetical protein
VGPVIGLQGGGELVGHPMAKFDTDWVDDPTIRKANVMDSVEKILG